MLGALGAYGRRPRLWTLPEILRSLQCSREYHYSSAWTCISLQLLVKSELHFDGLCWQVLISYLSTMDDPVLKGSSVLELGSGCGAVGMSLARSCGPLFRFVSFAGFIKLKKVLQQLQKTDLILAAMSSSLLRASDGSQVCRFARTGATLVFTVSVHAQSFANAGGHFLCLSGLRAIQLPKNLSVWVNLGVNWGGGGRGPSRSQAGYPHRCLPRTASPQAQRHGQRVGRPLSNFGPVADFLRGCFRFETVCRTA